MMDEDILNSIDEFDNPKASKTTVFKRKMVKSRSAQRVKLDFDDDNEEESIITRKTFKSNHSFIDKAKPTVTPWVTSQSESIEEGQGAEHDMIVDRGRDSELVLDLDEDPENNPIIENISQISKIDSTLVGETATEPEKRYVPIETNRYVSITEKQLRKEYDNDLENDGSNTRDKNDDILLNNEDYLAEDEPLNLNGEKQFQIDKDLYDLELPSENDESDVNSDLDKLTTSNAKTIKKFSIIDFNDQLLSLQESISTLKLNKNNNEIEFNELKSLIDQIKSKKEQLLKSLD